LQAFALIVTAEPYAAVRRPGDVVVLENQVRPDTTGKIEEVTARYELMPRGHYSWLVPDTLESSASNTPKVSMHKYEELLELYQAQNAVGIARAGYAEDYAPNTFAKAQQLLTEAQQLERSKADSKRVVQIAREAAEAAEDARVIAERRQQDEKLVKAQAEASRAQQARVQAEAEAQQAKIEAEAARARRCGTGRAPARGSGSRRDKRAGRSAGPAENVIPRTAAPRGLPSKIDDAYAFVGAVERSAAYARHAARPGCNDTGLGFRWNGFARPGGRTNRARGLGDRGASGPACRSRRPY